jgi:hypothetical protein
LVVSILFQGAILTFKTMPYYFFIERFKPTEKSLKEMIAYEIAWKWFLYLALPKLWI